MKDKVLPLINKTIEYLVSAFAFLLPVFFLPVTTEFFQFNKLALTTAVTLTLIILWAVKMLIEGKVEFTKSPLNLPILLIVVSFAISSYFSISRTNSIYGTYGRWDNSLVLAVLSALLYFVISSNIKSKEAIRNILAALIVGISLSSLVATLSYFGVKLSKLPYAQIRNFTLTGSTAAASAIGVLAAVLILGLLIEDKTKKQAVKAVLAALTLLNLFPLLIMGNAGVWALFIVGFVSFFLMTPLEKIKASQNVLYMLGGVVLVFGLVFSVPSFQKVLKLPTDFPKEVRLSLRTSWVITTSAIRDFPLLGSGPATFYLDFAHYRPLYLNATDQWNLRFDKPFNEILNIISTLGILGMIVHGLFLFRAVKLVKHTDQTGISTAMSAGVLGLFALYFFSSSNVLLTVVTFALLGLDMAYLQNSSLAGNMILGTIVESAIVSFTISGKSTNITTRTVALLFAVPMFLLTLLGLFFGGRAYMAEVMMRRSIQAAQENRAIDLYNAQRSAIRLNPYVDVYHNSFAQTNFVLANLLAGSKKPEELTDQDKTDIQNLIGAALQETRITTEVLNRTNPANWEQRARLYSLLNGVAKDADAWSVGAYTRAIELDPTNPLLRIGIGGIFYSARNFDVSERHFRAAVSLKPDLANAHYNLAHTLNAVRKYQEALTEMQVVMRLVPQDSQDYKKAQADFTAIKENPDVAGAQTTKPSVTDLYGTDRRGTTTQQPLRNPEVKEQPTIEESTSSLNPEE